MVLQHRDVVVEHGERRLRVDVEVVVQAVVVDVVHQRRDEQHAVDTPTLDHQSRTGNRHSTSGRLLDSQRVEMGEVLRGAVSCEEAVHHLADVEGVAEVVVGVVVVGLAHVIHKVREDRHRHLPQSSQLIRRHRTCSKRKVWGVGGGRTLNSSKSDHLPKKVLTSELSSLSGWPN